MPERRRRAGARAPAPGAPRCHVLMSSAVPARTGPAAGSPGGVSWGPRGFGTRLFVLSPARCRGQDEPPLLPQRAQRVLVVARSWGVPQPVGHNAVEHPPGRPQASRDRTGTRGVAGCAPTPGAGPCSPPALWGSSPPAPVRAVPGRAPPARSLPARSP